MPTLHKRVRTTTIFITGGSGLAMVYVTYKGQTYPSPIVKLLNLHAGACTID